MDPSPAPGTAISERLAAFAGAASLDEMPPEIVRRARYLMLDAVGIALAASRYEFAQRELLALSSLGTGSSTVIGMRTSLGLRDALLMNGSLVHGLDYDDTYLPGSMHLTASAVPAALGIGAHAGASGRDTLCALIVGMEASARIAAAGKGGFQQAGFHPTGVAAVFGCSLIASRLWHMTPEQAVLAQGIALSTACGTVQPMLDGTWTKRMHPGWAAASAVTATAMARQGYLGPRESYEGRFGLYTLYLGEYARNAELSILSDGLGRDWEFARSSIKLFPACHQAHAFMNAAIEIARERPVSPADVESITALIAAQGVNMVCEPLSVKRAPHDSYAAQFSLPYTVACSLLHGSFGLSDLEPARLKDPGVLELAGKLGYEIDPAAGFPKYRSGEVIVRFRDGTQARHRNHIMPDEPVAESEIERKFHSNACTALSTGRARQVMDALLSIEEAPSVEPVLRLLGMH